MCALARCRNDCSATRDCPLGLRCVRASASLGVCLLPDERDCERTSDCPETLVCSGAKCTNQCALDTDCLAGARCVETLCVELAEERCQYASNCPYPLTCSDGQCEAECRTDDDCLGGRGCFPHERCLGEPCMCRFACSATSDCPNAGTDCTPGGYCERLGLGPDASVELDAGPVDAGAVDGGLMDAGTVDAGTMDAGATDAGATDAGTTDAGTTDAGTTDAGTMDAGTMDAGTTDAGPRDAGPVDAGRDSGPLDAGDVGPPMDSGPSPWTYATSATAPTSYLAGDCAEMGDYDTSRIPGAPDCPACEDYCTGRGTTGFTPCSWFAGTNVATELIVTFASPGMPSEVRIWTAAQLPPGEITEVAVAASAAGPFVDLPPGTAVTTCTPAADDRSSLTLAVPGGASVGAVRVRVSGYNTGIDAVGMR